MLRRTFPNCHLWGGGDREIIMNDDENDKRPRFIVPDVVHDTVAAICILMFFVVLWIKWGNLCG